MALLLWCVPSCTAQQSALAGFGVQVNALAGKVVKHEAKFTLPIPALTTGTDINLTWQTYGTRDWHQYRHYPRLGLGIAYISYGIDSIYGKCIGLYPNIELPLLHSNKLEWTLRIGDGIGYATRRYERISPVDTLNKAVGAHVNDFAMLTTDARYSIDEHWQMQLGAGITHLSNGSYSKPNLGVNMMSAHAGITYYPVTRRPAHISREWKPLPPRWLVSVRGGMGLVADYVPNGPRHPVYIASGVVSRRWLGKNKVFAGADYSYHQNIYAYLRNNELHAGREAQYAWKSALFAGNEFLLGRVGVVLQVGMYTHQSAVKTDALYQKVGGHYYIVQHERGPIKEAYFSVFLKTHKTVAEFGELGFGISF